MSEEFRVSPYGGRTFRLFVCDCNETPILSEAISKITYTVYRVILGTRSTVEGHENVEVALAGHFFDEAQTSTHTGEPFNFEHRISAKTKPPFPECNEKYIVIYIFFDAGGEPHPCEIVCWSE
ncbi:MAG: hypothetical protein Q4D38_11670 [Planctomycetia bacterium]|nr:hypothetical protein [Planctomycetia bacterium]